MSTGFQKLRVYGRALDSSHSDCSKIATCEHIEDHSSTGDRLRLAGELL
jgi:hypothetical protein